MKTVVVDISGHVDQGLHSRHIDGRVVQKSSGGLPDDLAESWRSIGVAPNGEHHGVCQHLDCPFRVQSHWFAVGWRGAGRFIWVMLALVLVCLAKAPREDLILEDGNVNAA